MIYLTKVSIGEEVYGSDNVYACTARITAKSWTTIIKLNSSTVPISAEDSIGMTEATAPLKASEAPWDVTWENVAAATEGCSLACEDELLKSTVESTLFTEGHDFKYL